MPAKAIRTTEIADVDSVDSLSFIRLCSDVFVNVPQKFPQSCFYIRKDFGEFRAYRLLCRAGPDQDKLKVDAIWKSSLEALTLKAV
jgi:hypothetical protein